MQHNQPNDQRFTYIEPSVEVFECNVKSVLCASGGGNINDSGSDNYGEI